MTGPSISLETLAQRAFARSRQPIAVEWNGQAHRATDWSPGGFRVDGLAPAQMPPGRRPFPVRLRIPFADFDLGLVLRAAPTRRRPGLLACRFVDVDAARSRLLAYLTESARCGRLVTAPDLLDLPTPVAAAGPRPADRPWRRLLAAGLGLVVLGAALAGVERWAFTVPAQGGRVVLPQVTLRAPQAGYLHALPRPDGGRLRRGDPVLVLARPDGGARVIDAPCDCRVADRPVPGGARVAAGDPVLRLDRLTAPPLVRAVLPAGSAARVGQPARIRLADGTDLRGRVQALRPLADGRVRADLRPDGPLAAERVGQGARVRIDTAPWAGLLRPPGTAAPAQIPVAPANPLNP